MNTPEVVTEAHRKYAHKMCRYASARVRSTEIGEDLVGMAFMKMCVYLDNGRTIDHPKPFLYRVLNHLIIDEYRKERPVSLDTLLEHGFDVPHDATGAQVDRVDGAHLRAHLGRIPVKYREVLILRYVNEYSVAEIAARTGRANNTVNVQLRRGLSRLRRIYQHAAHVRGVRL